MEKCNLYVECNEGKTLFTQKNNFPIWDCQKCLRRFSVIGNCESHLSQVYCDDYFFDGKSEYANYLEDKNILVNSGVRYAKRIGKYTEPGKILDVGCAAGFILEGFLSKGWTGQGIEPNVTMAEYGKKELNIEIHAGSLEDFKSDEKFDLVTLIQVIGHFYDLDKSMVNISNLLTQNGLVLVESWNMKSIAARIFGKRWHAYSPPSTINWFSDESLKKLFKDHGFLFVDAGYPVKIITMKRAFSIIENKSPDFFFKKKIFSFLKNTLGRLIFIYPPFDVKWYIFRKTR